MTDVRRTAEQAFEAFKHAMETGDEKPLLNRMTEDCVFSIPMPFKQWQGTQVGKQRLSELIHFEFDELQQRPTFTLKSVATNGNLVSFEYDNQSSTQGVAYKNNLAIFFDVLGDKISGFREYVGVLDAAGIARAAALDK